MARVSAHMSLGVPSSQHSPPLEWAGIVEEGVIGGFESRPRCNSRVIPQKYDGLLFALQLTQGQHDGACGGPVRPRGTWRHLRVHLTYVGTAGSANLPFRLWRSWRNGEGGSEDAGMTHSYNVDFDGHRELQKEPSQGKPSALSWTAPATSIQKCFGAGVANVGPWKWLRIESRRPSIISDKVHPRVAGGCCRPAGSSFA